MTAMNRSVKNSTGYEHHHGWEMYGAAGEEPEHRHVGASRRRDKHQSTVHNFHAPYQFKSTGDMLVLAISSAIAVFLLYTESHLLLTLFLAFPILLYHFPHLFPGRLGQLGRRELRAAVGSGFLTTYAFLRSYQNISAADLFTQHARRRPDKVVLRYGDTNWTLQQIDQYANQVAHYFLDVEQLQRGDCVALVASSCPQYVAIWLGLNKIGCVTSLVNAGLKGQALHHAITCTNSKMVIVSADCLPNYLPILPDILANLTKSLVLHEEHPWAVPKDHAEHDLPSFDAAIATMPTSQPSVKNPPGHRDVLCYMFTSGTTGLPKPCIVTSQRAYIYALSHRYIVARMLRDDVLYCTLPLYHSSGGLVAIGQALFFGTTVVLRKSFSVSQFWEDIRHYKCTVFHYVGELCRYLLAQPPSPLDKVHSLRLIYGVGLRPQIWTEFVERFNIPLVSECYGSTEGNVGFVNFDGKPGAIGFTSAIVEHYKQQYLIKVNLETNEALRDASGFCIRCLPGEPGELVGKISNVNSFDGYLGKEDTKKKCLENVLEKGDRFFRTGDLLMKDKEGYVYFVDRLGDTFRWKGENVSTTEVEGTLSRLLDNRDVAVFGVEVPGCEGKAGMACIAGSDAEMDLLEFSRNVEEQLATFARPVFLRFMAEIELTGTFKMRKGKLKEAGYDKELCGGDHLYVWHAQGPKSCYAPLTTHILHQIHSRTYRF